MGLAFGITEDDVANVLRSHGISVSEEQVSDLFFELDDGAVESAALNSGHDLDDQTEGAYQEIWRQLQDAEPVRAWKAARQAQKLDRDLPQTRSTAGLRF